MVTVTNAAPIASSGDDQSVTVNAAVTLNGSGSSDPDGHTPLTYGWAQTGGQAVTLSDSTAVSPIFTAPDSATVITLTLTVTDSTGLAGAPVTVVVNVGDIAISGLNATNNSPTVLGRSTAFTATIGVGSNPAFAWNFGDGNSGSQGTGGALTATGSTTVTITAVNDAPVALTQQVTTTRNANVATVLFATDAESDPINYSLVTSPTHGVLSGVIPDLLYTPGPDFVGDDSFPFQAGDAQGAASAATVHISVQPSNSVPVAASFVVTTHAESAVAVNLIAGDADDDPVSFTFLSLIHI